MVMIFKFLQQKEKESEGYSFPGCEYSNGGGDFMPIKDLGFLSITKDEKEPVFPSPDLTLLFPGIKTPSGESDVEIGLNSKRDSGGLESSSASAQSNLLPKKQRRCWSPELHTRFVKALQELGGPQGERGIGGEKIKTKVGFELVILESV